MRLASESKRRREEAPKVVDTSVLAVHHRCRHGAVFALLTDEQFVVWPMAMEVVTASWTLAQYCPAIAFAQSLVCTETTAAVMLAEHTCRRSS
jgi:hypothetical protein